MHSSIVNDSSSSGHAIVKPASEDERPLVHLLDLAVEPATLQAATLIYAIYAIRDASADRCPPAATLQALVGGWSGRQINRGPSARLLSLPSQPHHVHGPSHSRPPAAARTRVPPVSANVGYITVQASQALLMRQIAVSSGEARAKWILAYVGGNALRHSREVLQPYDRHTQGTYWYMRGHAPVKPRTRSRITRTRSRTRLSRTRSRRHARAPEAR